MRDEAALWNSLPVPALLVGADDLIEQINPAAEGFLNASAKSVAGAPVWDRLAVDAPLEEAFARARAAGTPLFVNDVDVGTGDRPPLQCNSRRFWGIRERCCFWWPRANWPAG